MSMAYLSEPGQRHLEWLAGGTLGPLLDGNATDGQLLVGRFDVSEGGARSNQMRTGAPQRRRTC